MDGVNTDAYLICSVGTRACAVPLARVVETMRPLPLTALPGLPAFVSGVAIIRGAPVPVIDLSSLVGTSATRATRFVTLKTGERTLALAVDAVLGVRPLPPSALTAAPPLLRDSSAGTLQAISALDAELLLVLEASALLPPPLWAALDHAQGRP